MALSIYKGQTWTAYKPGEDERFPASWVTRNSSGELMSCVSKQSELIKNAILCKVRLKWVTGKPLVIGKSAEMSPTDFCYDYFGKEKYVEFEKFVIDRGLSAQDLYEAARATKWKIESNGILITKSGAEQYFWKILWNKVRAAFTNPNPEKIVAEKMIEGMDSMPPRFYPDKSNLENKTEKIKWANVNKDLRVPHPQEESVKPNKKRRINFDEE